MRKITLGYLNINEQGKRYVNDVLDKNRLSYGPYTQRFEKSFSRIHQCDNGVFCNSGTSALQIALAALKEKYEYLDGDEILVPATTFVATSNVVLQNNLTPVFVDVNPFTFNMEPQQIKKHVTRWTKAIIPVHLFGLPANMPEICKIADQYRLQILEDSCETMFADINKASVGSWGNLACFSTYVAHLIVGGVGGIVTGNDKELIDLCRSYMAHGRNSIYTNIDDDDNPTQRMIERRYSFERVGYSYRATELEAALALSQLEEWTTIIEIRRVNAMYLTYLLEDLSTDLQLPIIPSGYKHSFMMYPMVLLGNTDRDAFLMHLEKHGIETRYLFPLLSQPIYRKLFPSYEYDYPVAQNLSERGFFIGMHQGLVIEDLEYISEVIHDFFQKERI